jgi:S1-C subfamily serine protease
VIIDEEGHILTNEHVVDGASKVQVELSTGTTVTAKVVGTDKSTDVALLDIDVPATELDPVPLGDSSAVAIGDPVLAIGDPFGYQASASAGIVSGLDRSIQAPNGFTITGAIQTDAAVNHGNSGGALLNAEGELVGIPSQIADSGVNANVGVAFAVPVDTAKTIVASIEQSGEVEHAWLGVSTADVDANLAQDPGVGAARGALITGVTGDGPAARAGLTGGDRVAADEGAQVCVGGPVVTAVGDTPVASASDLQKAIDAQRPGATVALKVVDADGAARSVQVTLGTRPPSAEGSSGTTGACG